MALRCLLLGAVSATDPSPKCASIAGIEGGIQKCVVCGNYCGPGWCGAGWHEEGPACSLFWNSVAATDPTDSCCQQHDKCCGTAAQWAITGMDSCNARLKKCVSAAASTTTSKDPCGGGLSDFQLGFLGDMPGICLACCYVFASYSIFRPVLWSTTRSDLQRINVRTEQLWGDKGGVLVLLLRCRTRLRGWILHLPSGILCRCTRELCRVFHSAR
jgi:hypothetical protein